MAKTSGGTRVVYSNVRQEARKKIAKVIEDINSKGFSMEKPFKIGEVEKRLKDFANENGVALGSREMYMTTAQIAHSVRDTKKEKGLAVSEDDLKNFPIKMNSMDLYHDKETNNFTYSDGKNKYILNPNYEIKLENGKSKVVNYITASKMVDDTEFSMRKYTKIPK